VNGGENKVGWCCSRGRLFTIFVMLCGFDQEHCRVRKSEAERSSGNRTVAAGSGVGYGGGRMGTGLGDPPYGRLGRFGRSQHEPEDAKKLAAESAEKGSDRFDGMILAFLAVLWPSPGNNQDDTEPLGWFDLDPPRAVTSMLVNSKILAKAAELLRNDSLDNATQRTDLYMALISFLKRVGVHEVSKQEAMYDERIVLPDTVNLLTLSFGGECSRSSTASSLAECLHKLNIQCDMMMRNAQRLRSEFKDQRGYDMLCLCREISDLSSYLRIEQWWSSKHSESPADCSIVEVPDQDIWNRYMLARQAQTLTQSPAGRIRRLITEITSLKTGLSAGIFVKHAMSRLDVMK
jgi:hypothetical protein